MIAFTVTMLVTFYKFGAIPDTLCTCFFGAIAGECGVMGVIKSMKIRYEDRQWYKDDTGRSAENNEKEQE